MGYRLYSSVLCLEAFSGRETSYLFADEIETDVNNNTFNSYNAR